MASVSFDKATRVYPKTDKPAVDALDLKIQDGEFLVLVGPSGCGKSTSLRMLAGLEEIDGGSIHIGDRYQLRMRHQVTQIRGVLFPHLPYAQYSDTQLAHAVLLPSKVLLNASLHHRQNNRLAKEAGKDLRQGRSQTT